MALTNVTVTNNRAKNDNAGAGTGGGIDVVSGTLTMNNTIVAGNFNGGSPSTTADDIAGSVVAASSFNLVGTGGAGGLTNGVNSNQVGVASARLAPLANNGGPTFTHALLSGSGALDGGSNAIATAAGLTTDQRRTGFTRSVDAADANTTDTADIGALEQHPAVEDIADQTINEDGSLSISFNVGDSNLTAGIDTITVTSSNTALVPNANINVGGSGTNTISNSANASQTLVITPVANAFGTTTITVTATDLYNGTTLSMTDTFVLTVNPIADTPTVTNATTAEDTQTASGLVIARNAVDGAEVTHFKITAITGGTLFKNNGTTVINSNDFITFAEGSAGLKFTPSANLNTPAGNAFSFAVQAALDAAGTAISSATTATITVSEVNDPPVAAADSLSSVAEDSGIRVIPFATLLANDSKGPANESAQTLTISAVSSPVGGSVAINGINVEFTLTLNFNGAASFSYTVQDNGTTNGAADPKTAVGTVSFTVTPVNDPPVITGQAPISTAFNTARLIAFADLLVTDVDNPYPTGFTLSVQNGVNYTRVGNTITPAVNFYGTLGVPAQVNDGAANSNVFNLAVVVNPDPAFVKVATTIRPEPGGGYRISFIGNPGQTYTIQFTPALNPLNWQFLGIRTADANGNYSIVDIPPANTPMRFYRSFFP